jgi:hypothetical protein
VFLDTIVVHRYDGTDIVIHQDGPILDLLVVDDGTTGVSTSVVPF